LYDLRADPFERRNLIDDSTRHDRLTELRGVLADYLHDQGDPVLRFYLGTRFD